MRSLVPVRGSSPKSRTRSGAGAPSGPAPAPGASCGLAGSGTTARAGDELAFVPYTIVLERGRSRPVRLPDPDPYTPTGGVGVLARHGFVPAGVHAITERGSVSGGVDAVARRGSVSEGGVGPVRALLPVRCGSPKSRTRSGAGAPSGPAPAPGGLYGLAGSGTTARAGDELAFVPYTIVPYTIDPYTIDPYTIDPYTIDPYTDRPRTRRFSAGLAVDRPPTARLCCGHPRRAR